MTKFTIKQGVHSRIALLMKISPSLSTYVLSVYYSSIMGPVFKKKSIDNAIA